MSRRTRNLVLVIGTAWAQVLLVAGCVALFGIGQAGTHLLAGAAFVSAGLFVAMALVIDPLVPKAGRGFVFGLKLAAVFVFLVCSGLAVYGILSGRAAAIMLAG